MTLTLAGREHVRPLQVMKRSSIIIARSRWQHRYAMVMMRGLTLFELLIAIALMIVLVAIALPNLAGQFQRRSFDASVDQTVSMLLMARAHAQSTGRPVMVMYNAPANDTVRNGSRSGYLRARMVDLEDTEILSALVSNLGEPRDDQTSSAVGRAAFDPLQAAAAFEPGGLGDTFQNEETFEIYQPWSLLDLPTGVVLQQHEPTELLTMSEAAPTAGGEMTAAELELYDPIAMARRDEARTEAGGSFMVAMFLPDGTAMVSGDGWLLDRDGRIGRITLNRFTGLARGMVVRTGEQARALIEQQEQQRAAEEDDAAAEDADRDDAAALEFDDVYDDDLLDDEFAGPEWEGAP